MEQSTEYASSGGKGESGTLRDESGATKNLSEIREKASKQAVALKERVSEKARDYTTQVKHKADEARGKASVGLRSTSQRMQNLAQYLEEHDANDMSETIARNSRDLVRRHPGKTLLAGLVLGVLLGRLFTMSSHRPAIQQ